MVEVVNNAQILVEVCGNGEVLVVKARLMVRKAGELLVDARQVFLSLCFGVRSRVFSARLFGRLFGFSVCSASTISALRCMFASKFSYN